MKLHFEDNLDYQQAAIASVVDLFRGQEISRSEFTVTYRPDTNHLTNLNLNENNLGVGNRLALIDEDLLDNLNAIQLRHGLKVDQALQSGDFTVEMETGTGKTYVYLRTLFELNQAYGFSKFVIVVPSVAIKEGVYKTLDITREHFENLYPKAKGYEYFLYDSGKPGTIRSFATSPTIQIMVMTVGAINKKDVNNIYKENEQTGGERPIDLIKATSPILIVDEPQSVDGGLQGAGKNALQEMKPLCTLRYSATHVDKHHMVYRLDAVDAYQRGLVKQIEVSPLEIEGGHNKPYVKLISAHNRQGSFTAKMELDILSGKVVKRKILTVEDGDDLEQLTKRPIYENMQIGTIRVGSSESIELKGPSLDKELAPGQAYGGVDPDIEKRLMIRRTIKEHLDKEIRFKETGRPIKILSLFFIDTVEGYRQYGENGQPIKGPYAQMFEEEYQKLARQPEYQTLFTGVDLDEDVGELHDGYFSIDKKGGWTDTAENNQANRENAERAYSLIMKDKEKLLSFDTKLKFIFSHSALREGWDNPNVFQICTLRDMTTQRQRRQTIGRGLRLCVDQAGQRIRGNDINTLTVIAAESYQKFADNLQKEIEKDTGIRFGIVESHQFASIQVTDEHGNKAPMGSNASKRLWDHLKAEGLIDAKGEVQDKLRKQLRAGNLALPKDFEAQINDIIEILKKLAGKLDIKNADDRKVIRTREAILDSAEFKALWDRIKHKSTYRVNFDNAKLIAESARAIEDSLPITKTRARFRRAKLEIGRGGVDAKEDGTVSAFTTIQENDIELPDIITDLQDKTHLTRKSIVDILLASNRLEDFKHNPQQFMEQCAEAINRTKRLALVDGIKYRRIGDEHYYAQELFQQEELKSYLANAVAAKKSVFEYVVYDSEGTERPFAEDLEANETVKVYAKLPSWFKIPTPLGNYNPDWAVLIDQDGEEHLYFIVETKSSGWWDDLRYQEGAKIECGKKHFDAIAVEENPAKYIKATTVDDMMKHT